MPVSRTLSGQAHVVDLLAPELIVAELVAFLRDEPTA
jgi:hypothetical protein